MTKQEFYNKVTNSKIDIIGNFLNLLQKEKISYCVVGGIAINAYCEPLITLDFDCVVDVNKIKVLKEKLKLKGFRIKTNPYTWEITCSGSDIKIQLQRDKRYQEFLRRGKFYEVLGYTIKPARKEDILRGKLWAYLDPQRNKLKRDKDLLDIKRMIDKFPKLKHLLPTNIKKVI